MSGVIEIVIAPNGDTRVATKGFVGKSCLDASRGLVESLGEKLSEQKTSDFFATAEPVVLKAKPTA